MKISVNKVIVQSHAKPIVQEMFDYVQGKIGRSRIRKSLLSKIDEIVEESLNDIAIPLMRRNLEENESKFSGDLYENLEFIIAETGRVVLDAGPANEYAGIVERGSSSRPVSQEELNKLVEWVIHRDSVDHEKAIGAAIRIAATIESTGNIAHPYIQPAMEQALPLVKENIDRELHSVL